MAFSPNDQDEALTAACRDHGLDPVPIKSGLIRSGDWDRLGPDGIRGYVLAVARREPESLLVFSQEVPVDEERFRAEPIRAVERFLDCFDAEGRQIHRVPEHVLTALARCFIAFATEGKTLDEAFGGRCRQKWRAIRTGDKNAEILFALFDAWEGANSKESAVSKVAEEHCTSEENVRRIYRESRKRGD